MPDDAYPTLTDSEQLTLCGTLLRAMRVDRKVTAAECDALVAIVSEVTAAPGTAQRGGPPTDPVALIDRAAEQFPDDAALRRALAEVKRPEVQRLIYDAVFSLASYDTVSAAEEGFLQELARTWNLPVAS